MLHSRFTRKIILLSVIPLFVFVLALLTIQTVEMENLSSSTASITEGGLKGIYQSHLKKRSSDIGDKVSLKLDGVRNELNIVRGLAQNLIDEEELHSFGKKIQEIDYLRDDFKYNTEKNWSHLAKGGVDIGMGVWGYQHDENGQINQQTLDFTTSISPLKIFMKSVSSYGTDKSWLYLTGPKETPVMLSTPWANFPNIIDEKYPGYNSNNWWDFFFPGIVEGWESWLSDPNLKPDTPRGELTLTPLYDDAAGKGLMVTFFAPLWDKDRTRNAGAVGLDYSVKNIVALVGGETIGKTGFSFLLQSDGNVLGMKEQWGNVLGLQGSINKTGSGVHKTTFKLSESKFADLKKINNQIRKKDYSYHSIKGSEGKGFVVSFQKIATFNLWTGNGSEIKDDSLYLATIVSKDEILQVHYQIKDEISKVSDKTQFFIIFVSIALGVITIILAILYSIRETKQIRMMSVGAAMVKDKNFNVSVPVVSRDDLGELAQTFNTMILEIQSSYDKLQNHANELENKVIERTHHLQEANNELERLSQVDGLTNVYNRRYLDEHLDKSWRMHTRSGLPLSVMMIDIDYFKKFNDTYGHQAGDDCLCKVAQTLQNTLKRPTDIFARYGGEEFCAVVSSGNKDAMTIAELLRKSIEDLNISHKASDKGRVSISIGVNSMIPSRDDNLNQFIEQSDLALYKSKEAGRDNITLHNNNA